METHSRALPEFKSCLAGLLKEFLVEKLSCGYGYSSQMGILRRLDSFILGNKISARELPRDLVEVWIGRRKNESGRTQQIRTHVTAQFARFMGCRGLKAFVPDSRLIPLLHSSFVPYIFTRDELRRLFDAADNLDFSPISPLRQLLMPEFFRLLYGCGLRSGEACALTLRDVNLDQGILTIRNSKFHKDRLVPMAPELTARLKQMQKALGKRVSTAYFFPAPDEGPYCTSSIYETFRFLLWKIGIPHGGRQKGPRVHDLRHTFAVHRMEQWYREGADLNAKLPVLAAYMGHEGLVCGQKYLHLTLDLFADLSARLDRDLGHIIPRREDR